MPIRSTDGAVKERLGRIWDGKTSLTRVLNVASHIVDVVQSRDTLSLMTSDLLTDLETELACHYYTIADPRYNSKTTGKASASFDTKHDFWESACQMDLTGTLPTLGGPRIFFQYLGTPNSELDDFTTDTNDLFDG